ncbi:MAG: hypothetical protein ACSHYF_04975 [Verrucomicrobiaceae bacterium]
MKDLAPVLGFLIAFPLFWCFVCWLLSRLGGWKKVAKRYPRKHLPKGQKFSMQSMSFGLSNYNSCLTVHASDEGIDIAVWPLFACGHPPIFLPWSAIGTPREKRILWFTSYLIQIDSPPIAKISIPKRSFIAYQSSLPGPPPIPNE